MLAVKSDQLNILALTIRLSNSLIGKTTSLFIDYYFGATK
jgi:hypothetical protein